MAFSSFRQSSGSLPSRAFQAPQRETILATPSPSGPRRRSFRFRLNRRARTRLEAKGIGGAGWQSFHQRGSRFGSANRG